MITLTTTSAVRWSQGPPEMSQAPLSARRRPTDMENWSWKKIERRSVKGRETTPGWGVVLTEANPDPTLAQIHGKAPIIRVDTVTAVAGSQLRHRGVGVLTMALIRMMIAGTA